MTDVNKAHSEPVRWCAAIAYVVGIAVWIAFWILGLPALTSHELTIGTLPGWLWVPFGLCIFFMAWGSRSAWKSPWIRKTLRKSTNQGGDDWEEEEKVEYERAAFTWIDRYTGNLILAITIVIFAVAMLSYNKEVFTREWWPFYLFEFLALGIAAGLVFAFAWLGKRKVIVLWRHIKTVFFLYTIFFFLSGLIVFAHRIYDFISTGGG